MTRDFDTEARTWDQNEGRMRVSLAIAEAMAGALALSGAETVLDYGTGTGVVALRLAPLARQVICADASPGMLEVLEGKLRASDRKNMRAALLDLTRPAQAVALPPLDVIVSSMTLHHVRDVAGLARSFHGLLAPGGRLAVADLDLDGGEFHDDNTGVEHFGFERARLAELFAAAGFEVVATTTAHALKKPTRAGAVKEFSIFLLTARRP
jgi:SAM-dependent methyltransferase